MDDALPTAVDNFFAGYLMADGDPLADVLARTRDGGLPPIAVSALQGRMLGILVGALGATKVLEVGTLGGYSAISMASRLPAGGRLVSLEIDPHHAEVARASVEAHSLSDKVEVRVAPAIETLKAMIAAGEGPFDLVFIDADKQSNPDYFKLAMQLTRPGSLIVVDNVVRGGSVADAESSDASVVGVRKLMEAMVAEPRFETTVIQTVGDKSYDGFSLGRVL